MARLTVCEQARLSAEAHDGVQAELIRLLKRPIRKDQRSEIVARAGELGRLFGALGPRQARALETRLKDRTDPLARFFDCELLTSLRVRLRGILAVRAQGQEREQVPDRDRGIDDRSTDDAGTDNRGTHDERNGNGHRPSPPERGPDLGPGRHWFPVIDPPVTQGPARDIVDYAKRLVRALKETDSEPDVMRELQRLTEDAEELLNDIGRFIIPAALVFIGGVLYVKLATSGELMLAMAYAEHIGANTLAGPRIAARLVPKIDALSKALKGITDLAPTARGGVPVGVQPTPPGALRPPVGREPESRPRKGRAPEEAEERVALLYHGTTRRRGTEIEESQAFKRRQTWFVANLSNRDLAEEFARRTSAKAPGEGGPVVLVVEIPEETFERLRALSLIRLQRFDSEDDPKFRNRFEWILEPGGVDILNNRLFEVRIEE